MKVDQTRAFADALELDMQFQSNMDRMLDSPAYAKLKEDSEAIKVAFSRLCGGSRWTWAWFIRHNCPEAWNFWLDHADCNEFVRYNVNQCVQDLRKWGKENGYDVGDGTCER